MGKQKDHPSGVGAGAGEAATRKKTFASADDVA
jgi:hypothetical protein